MTKRLLECVPNFSEGRNMKVISGITEEICSVEGVKLLNVDPGRDTNRTVVTFVGDPEAVVKAAFRAVKKASELIDMRKHKGAHPRMGATDVCPFIPVSGITMAETVGYARQLAERTGKELNIPVYCYEYAALEEKRKNLANCRAGEYEGLKKKLTDPEWQPDYGPALFNEKAGATAVGARDFLVAFNVNLNTTSTRRANAIAFDVREKGRNITNENGEKVNVPGSLKNVKAIGWYLKEYGIAQISMNLTNISVTPVHLVFDEVCRKAEARGIRVTGSELVGLIPLKAILEAGRYFLDKQQRSSGVPDKELLKIAVKSMGLDDLRPFEPEKKIIEYAMDGEDSDKLVNLSLRSFMETVSSELPVPGGGSVSAYMASLGVGLGTMVANLSSHKRGWDHRWKEFSDWAEKGKQIQNSLLELVDEDTIAYRRIIEAGRLPKSTGKEQVFRRKMISEAVKYAIEVPFMIMETAMKGYDVIKEMVKEGNPASVTDAGVGALALMASVKGAFLNIKINAAGLDEKSSVENILQKAAEIEKMSEKETGEILDLIESILGKD
ncbi:MAG TPA: glutamate formimidoyltransferase [Bacteroidales bacterium]|nr:glutamate formimidoyltransferase [Bacteroidales bacterium]